MVTNQLAIQGASGTLAVGSLCFLGAFMIVDGATGLYVLVNQYAKDPAWAVVFAFPALVLSYVFGVLAISIGHTMSQRLRGVSMERELETFLRIAALKNSPLVDRYQALVQHQTMLEGASLGFALLTLGAVAAVRWLGPWSSFGWLSALGFLVLAFVCPGAAARMSHQAELLATMAETLVVVAPPNHGLQPTAADQAVSRRG